MSTTNEVENKYKDTINLPQTEFPMRGNGPVREPEFQKFWEEQKIYEKNLELKKNAKLFLLHDGPPYLSSDRIHIGTALNKILKDIVIKFKSQRGFRTPYVPGYDSHGLPIETAVVKEIKGGRQAVSVVELRDKCKDFALKNLKGQEAKFKRLGVLGDWDHPYVTLDPQFEAEQVRLFGEMAAKGHIYRGLKTVYWSYGAETALADAEVEYNDEHQSQAIYVAFKVDTKTVPNNFPHKEILKSSSLVIWTTTPWTIPGNLAIALNPDVDYVITQSSAIKEGEPDFGQILVAKDLVERVAKETNLNLEIITDTFKGKELEGLVCIHPLFGRPSPIIFGEHVTIDAGTGAVHTAPGHGHEDFDVGKKYGLKILCPVDGRGFYTSEAGTYKLNSENAFDFLYSKNAELKEKLSKHISNSEISFQGLHVIKEANDIIVSCLKDAGALLKVSRLVHSYPYCWRSKTPLLYRATEQWFCSVDGFRQEALAAIDSVKWIPERGRNRIYAMVEERGDWCISRQRTWGLPIPAIYDKSEIAENGNPKAILDPEIIEHVAKIFEKEGSQAWYAKSLSELLPASFLEKVKGEGGKVIEERFVCEKDTMDVWFDSGSTHRTVVKMRPELCVNGKFEPADLYLEGSDQHRGWFQSSLLTAVATTGKAPYKSVLTHGFVVDEKGRKMSKSVGNVVDPDDVIKNYGADILRLWVASVDYSVEIKSGDAMFKQLSDIYRNFRNTARYMLGNLYDFNPKTDTVPYDQLWELDRLILHRLQNLVENLTRDFEDYQFFKYYQSIQNFLSVDLSAFYFDIIKDRLYTHGASSLSRRAAQTVVSELLSVINRLFVPVLPHLAEDIFSYIPQAIKDTYTSSGFFPEGVSKDSASVLLSNWPSIREEYINSELALRWHKILDLRDQSNKEIEVLRKEKVLGKSLEASVSIEGPQAKLLEPIADEIKAVFIISELNLKLAPELKIMASRFAGEKCLRCWKLFAHTALHDGICAVCSEAVLNPS